MEVMAEILGGGPCKIIIDSMVLDAKHQADHLAMAMTHAEINSVAPYTQKELEALSSAHVDWVQICKAMTTRIESQLPG